MRKSDNAEAYEPAHDLTYHKTYVTHQSIISDYTSTQYGKDSCLYPFG